MTEDIRDTFPTATSPLKAIKLKCLDCTCGSRAEVEQCTVKTCPIYYFRLGKNPYAKKRVLTQEQREISAERFRLIREAKKSQA